MNREFNASSGSKFGRCIILQETSDKSYSLVFSLNANEFFVANSLNVRNGNWASGSYYGTDLQQALEHFNSRNKISKNKEKNEREER